MIPGNLSLQQSNLDLEDDETSKLQGLTLKDSSEGDQTHANKSPMHVMANNSLQSMQIEEVSAYQNLISLTSRVGDEANGSLVPTPQIQDASTNPASVLLTHLHNDLDFMLQTLQHRSARLPCFIPPTPNIQQVHNTRTNSTPSLEALAATAAAWWATHGLLPCFPPLAPFTFVPPNRNVPSAGILRVPVLVTSYGNFPKEKQQIGDLNKSEVIKPKHDSSKLLSSSSASDDCDGRYENSKELKDTGSRKMNPLASLTRSDLIKARNQK